MGWLDDLVGDVFSSGSQRKDPGVAISQQMAQTNARRDALKTSIITHETLDNFTRDELLASLNNTNYLRWDQLDDIEKVFADSRASQDEKYVNRRAVSNVNKERKDRPGLAAQTILTRNLMGSSPSGDPSLTKTASVINSGGPTLLTKAT